MVYWHDLPGDPNYNGGLINDINLKLRSEDQEFYPYVLNHNIPYLNATTGIDRMNNMEQVEITNPSPGEYKIILEGRRINNELQKYSLCYFIDNQRPKVTYPLGKEKFNFKELQQSHVIHWDICGDNGEFTIQFSSNNGNSWQTMSTNISGNRRSHVWQVPDVESDQCLIKVRRFNEQIQSESFVIYPVPKDLNASYISNSKALLSWNSIPSATSYDIYLLGQKYMNKIASTSDTIFTLSSLNYGEEYWYAISANSNSIEGQRSFAKKYIHDVNSMIIEVENDKTIDSAEPKNLSLSRVSDTEGNKFYPNPSNRTLNVSGDFSNIVLYDAQFKKVYEGNSSQIDISRLQKGIYYGVIYSSSGYSTIHKIIKI